MITKITKVYTRTYSDNGQTKTYVEWLDHRGNTGRTEGNAANGHIRALIERGAKEGIIHTTEIW